MRLLSSGMGWFPDAPGGLNRFLYDLHGALTVAGHESRVLVVGDQNLADRTGGATHALAGEEAHLPYRLRASRRAIARELRDPEIAVVAAHFAPYVFPALDRIDRPLVVHFQGPWDLEGRVEGDRWLASYGKRALEYAVYRRASRLIVLSQAFGDILTSRYRIDPARVRVIPGGVDAVRFDPPVTRRQARLALDLDSERPIVLAVRRLARRMGLDDLVEAMAEVRRAQPDALLLIAGKGPIQTDLERAISRHGLEGSVRLLGYVPDAELPLLYRAANLSVVPTVALEGFGLITLESLAAGTPVLVTPVGGLPEAVRDLEPGLVLRGTGAGPLVEGILAAMEGSLPLPSAEASQAYARERFSWPRIVQRVVAVYEEAIEEGASPRVFGTRSASNHP